MLAAELAARGRRVICPELSGRGLSDWLPRGERYTVPHYALALRPMRVQLGRPYDWVGTSMGWLIAMAVAAVPGNGLRRLVLNDVGPVLHPFQGAFSRCADGQTGFFVPHSLVE